MKSFDFTIITPSYAPDFERCRLLSQSIQKFVSPSATHYIIVDRRDLQLFRQLQGANTEVITVESILPWWIQRIPFLKNGWLSLKNVVLRNWIIQQIIKIGIAQYVKTDVLVFVDSDTVFIRPFNLHSFVRDDKVRFFKEYAYDTDTNLKGHQTANKLLGISNMNYPAPGYIGNVITWRSDIALKLCQRLEKVSGKKWVETLSNSWYLSEYILYGVFVDNFLLEQSGHYYDSQKICHEYWTPQPMTEKELQQFFTKIEPYHVAVMISAKAGMSVDRYEHLLKLGPQI